MFCNQISVLWQYLLIQTLIIAKKNSNLLKKNPELKSEIAVTLKNMKLKRQTERKACKP